MSPQQEAELNAWTAFDAAMLELHRLYDRGVPEDIGIPGDVMDRREQALKVNRLWQEWQRQRVLSDVAEHGVGLVRL